MDDIIQGKFSRISTKMKCFNPSNQTSPGSLHQYWEKAKHITELCDVNHFYMLGSYHKLKKKQQQQKPTKQLLVYSPKIFSDLSSNSITTTHCKFLKTFVIHICLSILNGIILVQAYILTFIHQTKYFLSNICKHYLRSYVQNDKQKRHGLISQNLQSEKRKETANKHTNKHTDRQFDKI